MRITLAPREAVMTPRGKFIRVLERRPIEGRGGAARFAAEALTQCCDDAFDAPVANWLDVLHQPILV